MKKSNNEGSFLIPENEGSKEVKELDPRRYLGNLELAKLAASAPSAEDLRAGLGLTVKQFCELMEIPERIYIFWRFGDLQPTFAQRILMAKIYQAAKKKGMIIG